VKKFIFLLVLAVVLGGFIFAQDTAHPPGVITLDAALSGDSVLEAVVTPDTDLVFAMPVMAEPSSIQAVMTYNDLARQPHNSGTTITYAADKYHLRC